MIITRVLIGLVALFFPLLCSAAEKLETTRFGSVEITRPTGSITAVVIVVADSTHLGAMTSTIGELAKRGALVAAVDTDRYLANLALDVSPCISIPGEFERLSQVIQNNSGVAKLMKPLLVGDGVGGGMVYLILAEAAKSFRGGVSLNFEPVLPIALELCAGVRPNGMLSADNKTTKILPQEKIEVPWFVTLAKTSELPRTYFAFSSPGDGVVTSDDPRITCNKSECRLLDLAPQDAVSSEGIRDAVSGDDLSDLPLKILTTEKGKSDHFVVFLSGDGGWATIDKALGENLKDSGVPVVGFDSLQYFWSEKTPEILTRDLERIIRAFQHEWRISRVILVGFSLGADVLPYALSRLPKEVHSMVESTILLSPGERATFEVHITDWLDLSPDDAGYNSVEEIRKIQSSSVICICGAEDEDCVGPKLNGMAVQVYTLPGSHHFDDDYDLVSKTIQSAVRKIHPQG